MMTPGKSLPPPTIDEIKNALQTIKKTCNHYNNCQICPLRTEKDQCGMFYNSLGVHLVNPTDYITESCRPLRIFVN